MTKLKVLSQVLTARSGTSPKSRTPGPTIIKMCTYLEYNLFCWFLFQNIPANLIAFIGFKTRERKKKKMQCQGKETHYQSHSIVDSKLPENTASQREFKERSVAIFQPIWIVTNVHFVKGKYFFSHMATAKSTPELSWFTSQAAFPYVLWRTSQQQEHDAQVIFAVSWEETYSVIYFYRITPFCNYFKHNQNKN